jgi:hypothetical protein
MRIKKVWNASLSCTNMRNMIHKSADRLWVVHE